ncbi:cellulase family glycosylhydrolase [Fontivita pretiosa]|uniref:cellulase family glycosylhydrolase n=1 Tax=Fontivita pretiosa TaxID=2989684 RepID=UPI003D1679AF
MRPLAAALVLVFASTLNAQLIRPVIPDGLGVNIHFTDAAPGEMKMLADAGFKFIRMDYDWAVVEKQQGQYDFAAYERLLKSCDGHGIRALFILDYVNRHYDDARSPDTDQGRAAFARWVAASVQHFRGRRILWEMYNEPNIFPFWRPKPNPDDYVKLALEVGKAIRRVAPDEIYIGPASAGIDLPFLETCFKAGLLEYWDAVSVHPYRQSDPETAAEEYRKLRMLIRKYAPKGKTIPILSGEWGYSSVWGSFDEEKQGRMLARQWLTNLANDVPLSIWYDWRDDGPDPKEPEHHFGTVKHEHYKDRDPPFDPKPAYLATRTLTSQLAGFRFNKRIALDDPRDHVLLFANDQQVKLVAWTQSRQQHTIALPASAGRFAAITHPGTELRPIEVTDDRRTLQLELTDAPLYIVPQQRNELLDRIRQLDRLPLEIEVTREELRTGRIPGLGVERGLSSSGSAQPQRVLKRFDLSQTEDFNAGIAQETHIIVTDPLLARLLPRAGKLLPVLVENPAGTPFDGELLLSTHADADGARQALKLAPGQTSLLVLRPAPAADASGGYVASASIVDREGYVYCRTPARRFLPLSFAAGDLQIVPDGDASVQSQQSIEMIDAPAGLPVEGMPAVKISYRFDPGWKFVCLKPKAADRQKIDAVPTHLGLWIKGDGSGNIPRMRFVDSTGQTFQPSAEKLSYTDWRYVEFPLDAEHAGHWGGDNDGQIHYPIGLETLLLIDSAARGQTSGTVYISSPILIYAQ